MPYSITENCNGCGACKKICPASAIKGTQKQPHTIEVGMCIDCGVCGKICPKAAVKDTYGMICTLVKRSEWAKPQVDNKKCMSCNICIDACPVACLELSGSMGKDKHGHPYVKNDKACIGCGFCAKDCPVDAIHMTGPA